MRKVFFLVVSAICILINVILTGCTTSTTVSYDENIIQKAIQRNVQLTPIYTDPALLPINYEVTKTDGNNYDVVIGSEVVQIEVPPEQSYIDSSVWQNNMAEITEGNIFKIFQTSKDKVVSYIINSQIIDESDKEFCINQINQTPLYFIDDIDSEQLDPDVFIPDAFYQDNAVWVFRTARESICEWMFTHELLHYLRELTNNVGTNLSYHGMLLDEVMTDIICSSLSPSLNGHESGYANYYDLGWKYISVWKEEAIKAYFYGYQNLWNKTGKDEFDVFVFLSDNYDYNELAHDCTIFTLSKWESLYSMQ